MFNKERKIYLRMGKKYDENFAFIEKVINSCENITQLNLSVSWALGYLERVSGFEYEENGSFVYFALKSYFDSKKNMIMSKAKEKHQNY